MNSIEWKGATPEQYNLWNKVLPLLVGVQTITPLCFTGWIAGSEFLTYDVKKLYIGLDVNFSINTAPTSGPAYINLYDPANAVNLWLLNQSGFWDATAAAVKYVPNNIPVKNIWFSRFTATLYNYINFNGYKITIP